MNYAEAMERLRQCVETRKLDNDLAALTKILADIIESMRVTTEYEAVGPITNLQLKFLEAFVDVNLVILELQETK